MPTPIAESELVLTTAEGAQQVLPVYKSTLIKFERRYGRPYATGSMIDAATMAYYLAHEQQWPPTGAPDVLDEWFDSVRFEARELPGPEANGDHPLGPPAQD